MTDRSGTARVVDLGKLSPEQGEDETMALKLTIEEAKQRVLDLMHRGYH